MFGDVFGNRDPDSTVIGWDASTDQTPTQTPTYRWQPALEQNRVAARYGYDPWTKSAYNVSIRRTRWWCWQWTNPVWHAALQYVFGSILFVVASTAALFAAVRTSETLNKWMYSYPYMLGSLNYSIGATILLYQSWIRHPQRLPDPDGTMTPAPGYSGGAGGGRGGADAAARAMQSTYAGDAPANGSVYESTYAASTFENVSRPPSFASVRWIPGTDVVDREPSGTSLFSGQAMRSNSTLQSGVAGEGGPVAEASKDTRDGGGDSVTAPLLDKRCSVGTDATTAVASTPPPVTPGSFSVPPVRTSLPFEMQEDLRVDMHQRLASRDKSLSHSDRLPSLSPHIPEASGNDARAAVAVVGNAVDGVQDRDAAVFVSDQEGAVRAGDDMTPVTRSFTFAPDARSPGPQNRAQEGVAAERREAGGDKGEPDGGASVDGDDEGSYGDAQTYATTPRSVADTRSVVSEEQSLRSYYHMFGRRWTAVSTAENAAEQHLLSVPSRHGAQLDSLLRNFYRRDALYYIRADPWYEQRWLLDLSGSISIWIGAMLYNVSCVSSVYEAIHDELPPIFENPDVREALLSYWPSTLGGVFFVLGSWFFWFAAHGTPGLFLPGHYTVEWCVTALNLVGSVGFFWGAVTGFPVGHVAGLVANWFELFWGFVLGSMLFAVGSYLMIVELASHAAASAALTL